MFLRARVKWALWSGTLRVSHFCHYLHCGFVVMCHVPKKKKKKNCSSAQFRSNSWKVWFKKNKTNTKKSLYCVSREIQSEKRRVPAQLFFLFFFFFFVPSTPLWSCNDVLSGGNEKGWLEQPVLESQVRLTLLDVIAPGDSHCLHEEDLPNNYS